MREDVDLTRGIVIGIEGKFRIYKDGEPIVYKKFVGEKGGEVFFSKEHFLKLLDVLKESIKDM